MNGAHGDVENETEQNGVGPNSRHQRGHAKAVDDSAVEASRQNADPQSKRGKGRGRADPGVSRR